MTFIPSNKIVFTTEEHEYLRLNYQSKTNAQLAEALGKNLTRTRQEMYSLGLRRIEMEYWTKKQVKFLKQNYKTKGDTEIAAYFNEHFPKNKTWTKQQIEKKRRYLKLKRKEFEIQEIVNPEKLSVKIKEIYRKEALRIKYGLPQKTKLRIVNIY